MFLMLISMIGREATPDGPPPPQDREPAMFQMQYTMSSSSADAAFVINDSRQPVCATQSTISWIAPSSLCADLRPATVSHQFIPYFFFLALPALQSTQVMVTQSQPGMGRMLQVTNNARLMPGLSIKTEVRYQY